MKSMERVKDGIIKAGVAGLASVMVGGALAPEALAKPEEVAGSVQPNGDTTITTVNQGKYGRTVNEVRYTRYGTIVRDSVFNRLGGLVHRSIDKDMVYHFIRGENSVTHVVHKTTDIEYDGEGHKISSSTVTRKHDTELSPPPRNPDYVSPQL